MDLILHRIEFKNSAGTFGEVLVKTRNTDFFCLSLEFQKEKLPSGIYVCKRVMHRVKTIDLPFETFEIGDTGAVFQTGNYVSDLYADNNVILAAGYGFTAKLTRMAVNSNKAFDSFMKLQEGLNQFTLLIR